MRKSFSRSKLGKRRSLAGRLANTLGISFYPEHVDVLTQRAKELNCPRSLLLQLLLEIERREHLLRRELIARLSASPAPSTSDQPKALNPA